MNTNFAESSPGERDELSRRIKSLEGQLAHAERLLNAAVVRAQANEVRAIEAEQQRIPAQELREWMEDWRRYLPSDTLRSLGKLLQNREAG